MPINAAASSGAKRARVMGPLARALPLIALLACSRASSPTPLHESEREPNALATAPSASGKGDARSASSTADASPPLGPPPTVYMGRVLAQPMSYRGADWLERPNRESTQKPEHALDVIGIRPGDVVADVGAGSGYFSERISPRVGSGGRVIATDLQPEMLSLIEKKKAEKKLPNLETRLTTDADAKLAPSSVDLVLMVDVYHELPRPDLTLAQLRAALRPDGRLALIEYRAEDPKVDIKPDHKMTLAQLRLELGAASFDVIQVDESLPEQRIVIARPRRP